MRYGSALCKGLCVCLAGAALTAAGCEQAEEPVISAGPNAERSDAGDVSGLQGRNSTLGKAKDTAESIVDQAEQQSQNVANQADGMSSPDR